jgi:hypothetical protein
VKRRQTAPQPYMPPAIGINAFRDAAAIVRCLATGDVQGIEAIYAASEHHEHIGLALGAFALLIAEQAGMSPADVETQLRNIGAFAADTILDQPHAPRAGVRGA